MAAPKPLTDRERQLAEIAANEKIMIENMKGASLRKSHAPGMNFPLTDRAVDALKKLVVAKPAPKPVVVASALPKKFSSPASTPLPASPVISSEEPKKDDSAKTVDDDEWDDDEEKDKEEKKEDKEEEKVEEKEEQAEEPAEEPVDEEEPEVPVKVERTVNFVKLVRWSSQG